ncbi:GATA transcription factor 21 [Amborella trichopoda]|uniref:GATA transcription factor 21 n=1 Tax=Amborella trichopoda TaxID=13333 RepID=UPI0005D464AA|nr:GATA transcription factor 21 [Amborella trichopoda]|eukprot:XP_011621571.1 GATA transcription factor 21 [Amborella trichopoda]
MLSPFYLLPPLPLSLFFPSTHTNFDLFNPLSLSLWRIMIHTLRMDQEIDRSGELGSIKEELHYKDNGHQNQHHPCMAELSCSSRSIMDDHDAASTPWTSRNSSCRVCVDCNTTKTPLWRSGPQGPKSLCNACGIRHRKARRAMAAAGDSNGDDPSAFYKPKLLKRKKVQDGDSNTKRTRIDISSYAHCQTRKRVVETETKGACFQMDQVNLGFGLGKHSPFHRVFPKDEEEAAVLLMALSYGLVHG